MQRRLCVSLFALLTAAAPALEAQTAAKAPRVGILALSDASVSPQSLDVFRQRLGELGYRDGENLRYEQRMASERGRLPSASGSVTSSMCASATSRTASSASSRSGWPERPRRR